MQNGADEHGPDRGDITAEWAHIGRLNALLEMWTAGAKMRRERHFSSIGLKPHIGHLLGWHFLKWRENPD